MNSKGTLLLSRSDVASLLNLTDYTEVVENAFRAYAMGETLSLGLLHVDTPDGEFHIKTGGITDPRVYCGLKMNGFRPGRLWRRLARTAPASRRSTHV